MSSTCNTCTADFKYNLYHSQQLLGKYLTAFEEEKFVPQNSHILYDISGGKYHVSHNEYPSFLSAYLKIHTQFANCCTHLCLDLNHSVIHTLCLDIDCEVYSSETTTAFLEQVLLPKFKTIFGCVADSFSVIFCQRQNSGGLHIIFPEFRILNDDYEQLCTFLQEEINCVINQAKFSVDIPTNYLLPFSKKPGCTQYYPLLLLVFNQDAVHKINLLVPNLDSMIRNVYKGIKKKPPKGTVFHLLANQSANQIMLRHFMAPVNGYRGLSFEINLFYPTHILEEESSRTLASFELIANRRSAKFIEKELQFTTGPNLKKVVFNYVQTHIQRIDNLKSTLDSVSRWYKKLQSCTTPIDNDIFRDINIRLKRDNAVLKTMHHPVKEIMTHNNYTFFVPMFYALHNELQLNSHQLCHHLTPVLPSCEWLTTLAMIDFKVIADAAYGFTYQTILYCSVNMQNDPADDISVKLDSIMQRIGFVLEEEVTLDSMVNFMCHIIKIYFPIRKTSKDRKFFWNPVLGQWTHFGTQEEVRSMFGAIADKIVSFYESNFKKDCQHKSANIREKCFNLLVTDNLIKNEILHLDWRIWTLRTFEGALDVLTGHVATVVPEHYISAKTMMLEWPTLSVFLNSEQLRNVCSEMWTESFMQRFAESATAQNDYVKGLMDILPVEDETALRALVHGYEHLCKFFVFHFEEMNFFRYAISSNLIATNYGKFIFILQGEKNNGKSRLFSIMNRIFGAYAATVDSEALSSTRKTETKPEIANNIFCCRILNVEELYGSINENFLKTLTGNSVVSARTLYETHNSGIPTAKLWITTNRPPACITTKAFRERILPFNFRAKFLDSVPETVEEQIKRGEFAVDLEAANIKSASLGIFLFMYYTVRSHLSMQDGYLHYPSTPKSIVEFKLDYLRITDIYHLFKTHMDVQVVKGMSTTCQDVKSAVRMFLISTKNTMNVSDVELIERFDAEFAEYKTFEDDLFLSDDSGSNSSSSDSDMEDKESKTKPPKRCKVDETYLCYRDVVIRNYKK